MLHLSFRIYLRTYLVLFFLSSTCWADLAQETIYLTWQRSPATTMTIQWVSPYKDKDSIVLYSSKKEMKWIRTLGTVEPFPLAPRYAIHRVELQNLEPNTEYLFKVAPYQNEYQFLTAPSTLEKELRFVVGGDMYHDGIPLFVKTCQKAAQTNPLFALVGGDIAYSIKSGIFSFQLTQRWIDWIKAWHSHMVTPQGHLIPVVAAIGNHDLIGQFDQTPAEAATFSALFPMPGKRVYNVLDFHSYLTIFILDSGHANPIQGEQADWLKKTLAERQQIPHRFAIYHVPAYPSIRDFDNTYSVAIRNSWVPLFEKGGVQAVFEHHDHAYKRTYPLLNNCIHSQGIVYFGDGGWGVAKTRKLRTQRSYLAKFASARHFIAVTLTPSQQQFKCINDEGELLDQYLRFVNQTQKASNEVNEL